MGVWYGITKSGRVSRNVQREADEAPRDEPMPGNMTCPSCGESKPASEFYGGGECRDCRASTEG